MAELKGFQEAAREAILNKYEQKLRDEIGPEFKAAVRERFETYADANDYDISHIWEDAEDPFVERDGDEIRLRIEWPGLTALFEWGVSPHPIEGDPVLAFVWEDAPADLQGPNGEDPLMIQQEVDWGSRTGGIPGARAIRDSLADLRADLRR